MQAFAILFITPLLSRHFAAAFLRRLPCLYFIIPPRHYADDDLLLMPLRDSRCRCAISTPMMPFSPAILLFYAAHCHFEIDAPPRRDFDFDIYADAIFADYLITMILFSSLHFSSFIIAAFLSPCLMMRDIADAPLRWCRHYFHFRRAMMPFSLRHILRHFFDIFAFRDYADAMIDDAHNCH